MSAMVTFGANIEGERGGGQMSSKGHSDTPVCLSHTQLLTLASYSVTNPLRHVLDRPLVAGVPPVERRTVPSAWILHEHL